MKGSWELPWVKLFQLLSCFKSSWTMCLHKHSVNNWYILLYSFPIYNFLLKSKVLKKKSEKQPMEIHSMCETHFSEEKSKPNSHPSLGWDGLCVGMWAGKYISKAWKGRFVPIILVLPWILSSLRKKSEKGLTDFCVHIWLAPREVGLLITQLLGNYFKWECKCRAS